MTTEPTIRPAPCRSCPYRLDCPSGVWHESEYAKLPEYDKETFAQPFVAFLCHDADRESELCRGWAEVHGKQEGEHALLSVRVMGIGGIERLHPCGVELHESGQAACDAGMERIENPSEEAVEMSERLQQKHGLEGR